ncbi:2-C-methyl-D-erythritol 4-phosphate cytidylyltransferase [Demequina sp.]|uniref:2-C-methyl-D-erythritol 4-phosphate cytidylyltransferase n=1 Tax=Demequina sp. TaxID=2050685 RepID=UPI003D0B7796
MTIAAVVTAAGRGTRLGSATPKALVPVAGRPLVAHALDRIAPLASLIVVTAVAEDIDAFVDAVEGRADVVAGGDSRQASVWAGLTALGARGLQPSDVVLVHDAARAFMPTSAMREAIAAVEGGADAAIPVIPVVDTLVTAPRVDDSYGAPVDRDQVRAVQTPQVFRASALVAAHEAAAGREATDDATLVRDLGLRVVATEGHPWGLKVTHAGDLALAAFIAANS